MFFYFLIALICCSLIMFDRGGDLQIVSVGDTILYKRYSGRFDRYSLAVLILLTAAFLRRPDLGADAPNYIIFFNEALEGSYPSYEWGFNALAKVFLLFSGNYQIFIALCSALTLVPIFFVIKREIAEYRWLAVYLFVMTQYAASFSVLRGYLSLAFVYLAYRHLTDRKKYLCLCYLAIALLFHNTSVVFILIFLFCRRRYKLYHYCAAFAASLLFVPGFVRSGLLNILVSFNGRYEIYRNDFMVYHGSFVHLCVFIIFAVLSAAYYKPLLNRNPKNIVLINICAAMLIFCVSFTWFPAHSRIVVSGMSFMCMLVPEIVACEKDKTARLLLVIFLCAFFAVYLMLNVRHTAYSFFFS